MRQMRHYKERLSHLVFLGGMVLCGGVKYPYIFLRWAVRTGVERLLAEERPGA